MPSPKGLSNLPIQLAKSSQILYISPLCCATPEIEGYLFNGNALTKHHILCIRKTKVAFFHFIFHFAFSWDISSSICLSFLVQHIDRVFFQACKSGRLLEDDIMYSTGKKRHRLGFSLGKNKQ